MRLDDYVRALERIFRLHDDGREAHQRSRGVLADLASDAAAIREGLARHLLRQERLLMPSHPALLLQLEKNERFILSLNCFFPHPERRPDVTWNGVHHHLDIVLTSVTCFGPGYEHLAFSVPVRERPDSAMFRLGLVDRRRHPLGHTLVLDAWRPHAVLFPPTMTVTVALWSPVRASPLDRLKRLRLFHGQERRLRELAARLGLTRALRLRLPTFVDFVPTPLGFAGLPVTAPVEPGPSADFVRALLHVVQRLGHQSLARDVERVGLSRTDVLDEASNGLVREFCRGAEIEHRYSGRSHTHVPRFNFSVADIELALHACARKPARAA
jgi:hypothetical protein